MKSENPQLYSHKENLAFFSEYFQKNLQSTKSPPNEEAMKKRRKQNLSLNTSPLNDKKGKIAGNSIYSFMDRVKQTQSPIGVKSCRTNKRRITSPKELIPCEEIQLIDPLELRARNKTNSEITPFEKDKEHSTSPLNFKKPINFMASPCNEEDKKLPKKSYQREISINTSNLDSNSYKRKTPSSQGNSSNVSTDKVRTKSFKFDSIFNGKSPYSPNRSILSDFLINRLGKEKFEEMKGILEKSQDPILFLDEEKQTVMDILGEQNMECVKLFRYLISSSTTPPNQTFQFKLNSAEIPENEEESKNEGN